MRQSNTYRAFTVKSVKIKQNLTSTLFIRNSNFITKAKILPIKLPTYQGMNLRRFKVKL